MNTHTYWTYVVDGKVIAEYDNNYGVLKLKDCELDHAGRKGLISFLKQCYIIPVTLEADYES